MSQPSRLLGRKPMLRPMRLIAVFAAGCMLYPGSATARANWRAACAKVKGTPFPQGDKPGPTTAKKLQGCAAAALYYGLGTKPDPRKARLCAFLELEQGDHLVFGGTAVLMMVYANGRGAKRNLPLALRLACDLEGAPAETPARVDRLLSLGRQKEASGDLFDVCDDISSGLMMGHCAGRDGELARQKRRNRLLAILSKWSKKHQRAFQALQRAATQYFRARVANEVDLSGSGRSAFQVQEETTLEESFVAAIEGCEKGAVPHHRDDEQRKADALLRATYRKIQNQPAKAFETLGTVTKAGITTTQRLWQRYRDEWLTFARHKFPKVNTASWKTWLTRQRTQMLRVFLLP